MAAIYVRTDGKDTLFAAVTDRQNSLTAVMDVATGKIEKFSYKPWGMRRNPANWSENVVTDYPARFSRGYCMHEHFFVKYQINDFNMRIFVFVIMILLSVELFAKRSNFNEIPVENISQLDKMGIEDSLLLNEYESDYFNVVYKDSLNRFDFSGKKVGFIYSGAKSSKKEYFDLEKKRFKHGETPNSGMLYIFDEAQKEESGGYDAVIVYWSKVNYSKEQVVKKIKGKSRR